MSVAVTLVVVFHIGDETAVLAREVYSELIAVALCHHVVLPYLKGVCHRAVFAFLIDHGSEAPTEVGVAGCLERGLEG